MYNDDITVFILFHELFRVSVCEGGGTFFAHL
jgi:hypothetical protein